MYDTPMSPSLHSLPQNTSSMANLAAFLRSTGPPQSPTFRTATRTPAKSMKSRTAPRAWLRKAATKLGMRKESSFHATCPDSAHLSIKEFSDGTSVKMIASPVVPEPTICRIPTNPRLSASFTWASPTNPLGVLSPAGEPPLPPSPNISIFSPRPPSPIATIKSKRRRSATVSGATLSRVVPLLPRFSFHLEEDEADSDGVAIGTAAAPSLGLSDTSSVPALSYSNEARSASQSPTTTMSSALPTPLDVLRPLPRSVSSSSSMFGLRSATMSFPSQCSPQLTLEDTSCVMKNVVPLQRKSQSKSRGRSSTILSTFFDPLTLGSPEKPRLDKDKISLPLPASYTRGRRESFLEDVQVEQDLGWGARVMDLLKTDEKQVIGGLPQIPSTQDHYPSRHFSTSVDATEAVDENSLGLAFSAMEGRSGSSAFGSGDGVRQPSSTIRVSE